MSYTDVFNETVYSPVAMANERKIGEERFAELQKLRNELSLDFPGIRFSINSGTEPLFQAYTQMKRELRRTVRSFKGLESDEREIAVAKAKADVQNLKVLVMSKALVRTEPEEIKIKLQPFSMLKFRNEDGLTLEEVKYGFRKFGHVSSRRKQIQDFKKKLAIYRKNR